MQDVSKEIQVLFLNISGMALAITWVVNNILCLRIINYENG